MKECPITGEADNLIKLHSGGNEAWFHKDVTLEEIHRWEQV